MSDLAAPLLAMHASLGVLIPVRNRLGPFEVSPGLVPVGRIYAGWGW